MPHAHRAVSSLDDIAEALRSARRITAICHENPDADTLGAAIAVRLIGERLGAEAEVVSVDLPPPAYAYLPGIEDVRRRPQLEPGLAVTCDAATLARVGQPARDAEWLKRCRLVNIDHHVSNDFYGELNLVDPTAAATCEIVAQLVPLLGLTYDVPLATALLAGIVRDSHGFSASATSAATLRIAADLVDAGAPLSDIHRHTHAPSWRTMALWGRMLQDLGQRLDGRIVYTSLTESMLGESGAQQDDADGIVEFIATSRNASVALLCREIGPSETRVSIRTADTVDATAIARAFGGGGHRRRAGCSIPQPLDAAIGLVLREAVANIPADLR